MTLPAVRAARGSSVFRAADRQRLRVTTSVERLRDPHRFDDVRTVLVVIGHVKSGGTMLGALLDAHPNAAVSDEVGVLALAEAGFSGRQMFHLIEKGARREALKGRVTARRLGGYSFSVPGHQGSLQRPALLMGDTRGGPTTRRLGEDVSLLGLLAERFSPAAVRYVHVVRSPFDPISAMVRRSGRTLESAIADHAAQCGRLDRIRAALPAGDVLTVRYEEFTSDPVGGLRRVADHLALPVTDDYLAGATAIIRPDREGERSGVEWSPAAVSAVDDVINAHDFLRGYRWS